MRVVIPAAGLGTRFLPLTRAIPKEMLPLGTRPLIHHALIEAAAAGFESAVIVIAPGKEAIRNYFEPDDRLESLLRDRGEGAALARLRDAQDLARRLRLSFAVQPQPGGLGEAVLRGGDGGFAVLLPDDVIPESLHWVRLLEATTGTGAAGVCFREVPADQTGRFGIVTLQDSGAPVSRVTGLREKPPPGEAASNLAILGRYVLNEEVLAALRRLRATQPSELQLTAGLAACIEGAAGVLGARFAGRLFDSGTPEEYSRSVAQHPGDDPGR